MITKSTQLYISVSRSPTNFGTTVYSHLFSHYGIDAIYVPRVAPRSAGELIAAVRTLDVQGCSVSMPLKGDVLPYLDWAEPLAEETEMVNTIIHRNGALHGYNCDAAGMADCLDGLQLGSALIYGYGAIFRTAVHVLRKHGVSHITGIGRDQQKARAACEEAGILFGGSCRDVASTGKTFDILINATPGGAEPTHELLQIVPFALRVFDVVLCKHTTPLVEAAVSAGKQVTTGQNMYIGQLARQFFLYTDISPDQSVILEAVSKVL